MTDKEKIRTEIERLLNESAPSHDSQCKWEDGYWCALYKIEEFIDSLQKEHINEELEEAANKYIKGNYSPWLYKAMFDCFKAGAKWQEEKDDEEKVLIYKHGFDDCKEHIKEILLSEVLPYFMHSEEADEVVAKLDKVLIKLKEIEV